MSYAITCAFSGVPIDDCVEVVVIPIYQYKYATECGFYHNIFDLYRPYLHPINCFYLGDGVFSSVKEDFSTRKIEEKFNVTIDDFLDVITGHSNAPIPKLWLIHERIESMVILKETYDVFVRNNIVDNHPIFAESFQNFKSELSMNTSFIETKRKTLNELKRVFKENGNDTIKELIDEHEQFISQKTEVNYSFLSRTLKAIGYHIYFDNFNEEGMDCFSLIKELIACQQFMVHANIMYRPNYTGSFQGEKAVDTLLDLNKHREFLLNKSKGRF